MIQITLTDGSLREYDQPLSVYEVAASIGAGLAKAAVAGRVDGVLVDCEFMIEAMPGSVSSRRRSPMDWRSCAAPAR